MKKGIAFSRKMEFASALYKHPQAEAIISGSEKYPEVKGVVSFYKTKEGTLLVAEVFNLPYDEEKCSEPFLAFHIHEGGSCTGDEKDLFADAGVHYNPKGCPHPAHAGDLPPLLVNKGYAFMIVLTEQLEIKDIIGKTVIIHAKKDDFTSQPSGNAGEKIACGVILGFLKRK